MRKSRVILVLVLFVLSVVTGFGLVSRGYCTEFGVSGYDSQYGVYYPQYSYTEDGNYATLGNGDWIVFDFGDMFDNITKIYLKEAYPQSGTLMDLFVSADNSTWFRIANDCYYGLTSSPAWASYVVGLDHNMTRFVKIMVTGGNYYLDDIHVSDESLVLVSGSKIFASDITGDFTIYVKDCMTGLCGYWASPYNPHRTLMLLWVDNFVDYKFAYPVEGDMLGWTMFRASGTANVEFYVSNDTVSWTYLTQAYTSGTYDMGGNMTFSYLRLLSDGTGDKYIYAVWVDNAGYVVEGGGEEEEESGIWTSGNMRVGLFGVGFTMFGLPLLIILRGRRDFKTVIKFLLVMLFGFMFMVSVGF